MGEKEQGREQGKNKGKTKERAKSPLLSSPLGCCVEASEKQ